MQPEEVRDDRALLAALEATVVLDPRDFPCSWAQQPPCPNIALYQQSLAEGFGGPPLCIEHWNWWTMMAGNRWWNRPPTQSELAAGRLSGRSTSEIVRA